jgi:hypothetical protein
LKILHPPPFPLLSPISKRSSRQLRSSSAASGRTTNSSGGEPSGHASNSRYRVALSEARDLTNVRISVQLKNVGLSKVAISQEGSAIRVFATDPTKTDGAAEWQRAITVGVFEKHGWIEPGETITDQALVSVSGVGHKAIKLELRLVGDHIEWNALCIIEPEKNSK